MSSYNPSDDNNSIIDGSAIYIAIQTLDSKVYALRVHDYEINLNSKRGTFFIYKNYNKGVIFQIKSKKSHKSKDMYYLALNRGGFYLTKKKCDALWIDPTNGSLNNNKMVFKISNLDSSVASAMARYNSKFIIITIAEQDNNCNSMDEVINDISYTNIIDRCQDNILSTNDITSNLTTNMNLNPILEQSQNNPTINQQEVLGNQNIMVPSFNTNALNNLNQRNEQICKNNNGVWVTSDTGSNCVRCTMGSQYPDQSTGICRDCPTDAVCGDHGSCFGKTNPSGARCVLVNNKYVTSCNGVNNCGGSCSGYCPGSIFGWRCVKNSDGSFSCKFVNWWKLLLWVIFGLLLIILLAFLIKFLTKKKKVEEKTLETTSTTTATDSSPCIRRSDEIELIETKVIPTCSRTVSCPVTRDSCTTSGVSNNPTSRISSMSTLDTVELKKIPITTSEIIKVDNSFPEIKHIIIQN